MTDSTKRTEAAELAEALTPGPWAALTALIIITVWCSLESYNDLLNLSEGRGVPLIKTDETWMTDISGVTEGLVTGKCIPIPGDSSMKYQNYLLFLLMTQNEKTTMLRTMDLIQINMKGSVREDFTISDHVTGFSVIAEVSKKSSSPYIGKTDFTISQLHTYAADFNST